MWKESYRIGIECIDKQHMELFDMADKLLKDIDAKAGSEQYRKAIEFLKDYVVFHFKEEEAYQESISYSGIAEHKNEHRSFTNTVLDYERRLEENNYDIGTVKELAGTLTAWLIYHVCDADQKIANGDQTTPATGKETYPEIIMSSAKDVLHKMAGLSPCDMKPASGSINNDNIFVEITIHGKLSGRLVIAYTKQLAFNLVELMTFTAPEQVDELVCSALAELSNITSGKFITALNEQGIPCDINPPMVSLGKSDNASDNQINVTIDTGVGIVDIGLAIQ